MLDIKYIRDHKSEIQENIQKRRMTIDIDELLKKDLEWRLLTAELENKRSERNKRSKQKPTAEEIERLREFGEEIKSLEYTVTSLESEIQKTLLSIPNITHPNAPTGGEADFTIMEHRGEKPTFSFPPKDHEALLTARGLIDFERGANVAGSKFYYVQGDLVRLNQALLSYGMDILERHGFSLFETPDLAKEQILIGAGFNPRGEEDQIYTITNTDLALIGTAEITMLGYHSNEQLDLSQGPKKYAAISHCFRKEAGAYGRTSKGLYRVHQFTKLEMFIFCTPEESEKRHQEILAIEKEICDGLGLHYRVIDIASADLGAPAYRKFDIEAYMTMKGTDTEAGDYGEITSTSNCLEYQARRANIRYKKTDGTTDFVHTLNGTAIVLSRFPIAIIEQYQQENGTIRIPDVLQPYMGGKQYIGNQ